MWTLDLLISLLVILSFLQIGLLIDYYLITRRLLSFNLAVYFGLGLGFVAILQMIFGILAIPTTRYLVILATIITLVPIFVDRRLKKQLGDLTAKSLKKIKPQHVLGILTLLIFFVTVGMITFSHPVWGYDATQHWLAKARAFWIDGGITRANLFIYPPPDNPNLWSLNAAWIFHLLGKSSDFWVQIIPFTVLVLLVGEFFRIVAVSKQLIWAWVLLLMFTPFLWQTVSSKAYSGNADLLVSFYLFLATGALVNRRLVWGAIFFGLSALVKNDALPALIGFCLLLPIFSLQKKEKFPKVALILAIGLLLFNLGWKFYFGLGNRYLQNDWSQVLRQRPILEYTWYSIQSFREQFRFLFHWGIGFWVIFFFLITRFRRILRNKWLTLSLILIAAQFVGYIWVYYVTGEDQASQIATSIYRLVLQVYPALLLLAFTVSKYESSREFPTQFGYG
ncbi:hypothetical protein HYU92_02065 [Candidatus Curtissbacteria bacterium]|nr:hypothetical protein [Candidatus Curtissbacteria bacterium]